MVDIHPIKPAADRIRFRKPDACDGPVIWDLVASCAPLDRNSIYCNLIQCDHFRDTCILAERDGVPVGWISGHVLPSAPETFFVWQVAVAPQARGLGLGKRMLAHLLARDICADITTVQTTITADNAASWALFRGFATAQDAALDHRAHFTRDTHFQGAQATEHLVTIRLSAPGRLAAVA